jgi:hypothetical protein
VDIRRLGPLWRRGARGASPPTVLGPGMEPVDPNAPIVPPFVPETPDHQPRRPALRWRSAGATAPQRAEPTDVHAPP